MRGTANRMVHDSSLPNPPQHNHARFHVDIDHDGNTDETSGPQMEGALRRGRRTINRRHGPRRLAVNNRADRQRPFLCEESWAPDKARTWSDVHVPRHRSDELPRR